MSRFLDGRPDRSPDLGLREALPGDRYLLCSDGLWEPLSDPALGAKVAAPDPLGVALTRACDAALAAGGTDNVTMVAARWLPTPSANV